MNYILGFMIFAFSVVVTAWVFTLLLYIVKFIL
jgi:hypothetical protein